MFRAFAGDPPFRAYLSAWCRAGDLGEFLLQVDPEDAEHMTVARFSRIDVRGWDRKRLARHIRIQQRKGRFVGVTIDGVAATVSDGAARVPLAADGAVHQVVVRLGEATAAPSASKK